MVLASAAVPILRRKKGGSKSRTGCLTCKLRHVKCDEARPHCQRCLQGNRPCQGYTSEEQKPQKPGDIFILVDYVTHKPQTSIRPNPELDDFELRALDHFQFRTATQLAGPFSIDEWARTMLQFSHREPAVRHSIIAVGSLHHHFENRRTQDSTMSEFTMQHYSRAVKQVLQIDPKNLSSLLNVALITCILFTALESMQGHFKSALTHVTSTMNFLEDYERNHGVIVSKSGPKEILHPLLLRLKTQLLEIRDAALGPSVSRFALECMPSFPTEFVKVEEAMLSFDAFYHCFSHFVDISSALGLRDMSLEEQERTESRRRDMMCLLREWGQAFDKGKFVTSLPSVLVLQANRLLLETVLEVCLESEETVWDNHLKNFEDITRLAELFIESTSLPISLMRRLPTKDRHSPTSASTSDHLESSLDESLESSDPSPIERASNTTPTSRLRSLQSIQPTFTMALGVVPALYVTVIRCRDPIVRKRALHLLFTCKRREGIWDATLTAIVAKAIVVVEETTACEGQELFSITKASQIPEYARVRRLETTFGAGKRGRTRYYRSELGPRPEGFQSVFEDDIIW